MGYRRNKPDAGDRVKASKALDLRLTGMSYAAIADTMGYASEAGPRTAVDRLLGRVETENAAELRRFESLKLDALQAACWEQAVSGDLDAIKTALAVHDRRVRLLGLAAPTAVDVNLRERTTSEILEDYREALHRAIDAGA